MAGTHAQHEDAPARAPVGIPQATGIYCRMSLAVMNDPTKVEDQARIGRELAGRLGWGMAAACGHPEPGGVYTDNSRSAWKRDRKRPAWDQMLADLEAGRLDAIIVYHGDRLVRQPFDLEALIRLADGRGLHLASPTGVRDLDSADDRFVLRILCAQACMESDNTSRRKKAQYDRMRREGKVRPGGPGGRAYGFSRDGITHIPAECEIIREIARRITAGEGAGAICASLNARGLVTVTGKPWAHGTLRKMIARPRYAGLMPDGVSRAAWEPVLGRGEWEMACSVLRGRAAGFGYVTSARRHLLSGIAVCGTCGEPVAIRHSRRSPALLGYGCISGHCGRKVHRSAHHLDMYVRELAVRRLNDPAAIAALAAPAPPGLAAQIIALERRRDEAARQLENLADLPGLTLESAARAVASFDGKIALLRSQAGATARARLLRGHAGITGAQWDALTLGTRRALIAAMFRIEILPSRHRGPGFDPEAVRVTPAED